MPARASGTAIDIQIKFRDKSCSDLAERFAIPGHQGRDLTGRMGKAEQSILNLLNQLVKVGKVAKVRCVFLDLFPQEFNRVKVRRVRRQLEHRDTVSMLLEELLHGLTGVVFGAILDQDQMSHHLQQELGIAVRIEAPGVSSVEQLFPSAR
jgi:hypothetical protein